MQNWKRNYGHWTLHFAPLHCAIVSSPKKLQDAFFGVIILLFVHASSFFSKKKKEWRKLCTEILQCQGCKCKVERRKQRGIVAQDHN